MLSQNIAIGIDLAPSAADFAMLTDSPPFSFAIWWIYTEEADQEIEYPSITSKGTSKNGSRNMSCKVRSDTTG